MKALRIVLMGFLLNSCATHRQSQLSSMGVGAVVGGSFGAMSAPKDESKLSHGALWAALFSSGFAIASLYLFDNEKTSQDLKIETEALKAELIKFKKSEAPRLLSQGSGLFSKSLPDEARKLISPGEWRKYSVDQWVQDSGNPNTWLHYNLMYEFIPPSLTP